MAAELLYSLEIESPTLIEQGRANVLRAPLRREGALAPPSSGTISIYDASGTAVVSGAAVTVTDGIAQYTTGTLTSSQLGTGWRIVWLLTAPDGHVKQGRCTAALVRCVPSPVVSDRTISSRIYALDPKNPACITAARSYQDAIEHAWKDVSRRLARGGNRVNLIISGSDLEEAHLMLTISRIFENLAVTRPEMSEQAKHYRGEYERAWGELSFEYDSDDGGSADTRKPAASSYWLAGR